VQGPEIWLNTLGVKLPCAVDPQSAARLDAEHRVFVNWETYFVSDPAAMAAFREAPWEFCGLVTDPVSRVRFRPTPSSPRRDRGDRPFFFHSDATVAAFDAGPEAYEKPMIGMVPKK
jgi:hypothetical protein